MWVKLLLSLDTSHPACKFPAGRDGTDRIISLAGHWIISWLLFSRLQESRATVESVLSPVPRIIRYVSRIRERKGSEICRR